MKRLLALGGLVLLIGCGGHKPPTPPSPPPSPSPAPAPSIVFPLKTAGTKFVDATGKPVWLSGAIECCNAGPTKFHWPLASKEFIDLIAANSGNYTHMRLGPLTKTEDPGQAPYTQFRAYATNSNGRADINSWNQKYWTDVDALIKHAASKGVVVEMDLLDAWSLKEGPNDAIGHPWCLRYSNQLFNKCYANNVSLPPHEYALKLLDKAVMEWGDNPNIIWEISNESGVVGKLAMGPPQEPLHPIPEWEVSVKFELAVVDAVRAAEAKYGYVRHLIGTNSERAKIERDAKIDYINKHERFATHPILTRETYWNSTSKRFEERASDPNVPAGKPVTVNEYPRIIANVAARSRQVGPIPYEPRAKSEYRIVPDVPVSEATSSSRTSATAVPSQVDLYKLALEKAYERGTFFHLWRGNFTQAEFLQMLAVLKQFKKDRNLL